MNFDTYIRNDNYFIEDTISCLSVSALKHVIDAYLQDPNNPFRYLCIKKQIWGPSYWLRWNNETKTYYISNYRLFYISTEKIYRVTSKQLIKWLRATIRDAQAKIKNKKEVEEYECNLEWERILQISLGANPSSIQESPFKLDTIYTKNLKRQGILYFYYLNK